MRGGSVIFLLVCGQAKPVATSQAPNIASFLRGHLLLGYVYENGRLFKLKLAKLIQFLSGKLLLCFRAYQQAWGQPLQIFVLKSIGTVCFVPWRDPDRLPASCSSGTKAL